MENDFKPKEVIPCKHPNDCPVYDQCPYRDFNAKNLECPVWNQWTLKLEGDRAFFRLKYKQELEQRRYSIQRSLQKRNGGQNDGT